MADASARSARRDSSPRLWLHLLLLVLTFLTTTMVGMRYAYNFSFGRPPITTETDIFPFPWVIHHLAYFGNGLPFSLSLLAIVLSHEFGHYFSCMRHGAKASLPYLLPAPTLSGTAGAVIRLNSRIRNRMALLDIGISGPICGYLAAVPLTILGLLLSKPQPPDTVPSLVQFHAPLTVSLLRDLLAAYRSDMPPLVDMVPHPILVASWVGLFITSLNLIPAGQLDGGHILYAISPKRHANWTSGMILLLILAGAVYWMGWLVWALVLMLPGMRHSIVPADPPPSQRQSALLGVAAAAIFLLTSAPEPFVGMSLMSMMQSVKW